MKKTLAWTLVIGTIMALPRACCAVTCLPSDLGGTGSVLIKSDNPRGCWAGWWCPGYDVPYVAAARRSICDGNVVKAVAAEWLSSPDIDALVFGQDPHSYQALLDIWVPERAKLDAVRPK